MLGVRPSFLRRWTDGAAVVVDRLCALDILGHELIQLGLYRSDLAFYDLCLDDPARRSAEQAEAFAEVVAARQGTTLWITGNACPQFARESKIRTR